MLQVRNFVAARLYESIEHVKIYSPAPSGRGQGEGQKSCRESACGCNLAIR
jgi:hypothetical protein